MSDVAPIILIEDDEDDFELMHLAYRATGCKRLLIWFDKPDEALSFLKITREAPFMIIADINMPLMDGIELRTLMRETKVRTLTAVPFFFLTTSSNGKLMQQGYELLVQGFFTKPADFHALVEIIDYMIQYSTQQVETYELLGQD